MIGAVLPAQGFDVIGISAGGDAFCIGFFRTDHDPPDERCFQAG